MRTIGIAISILIIALAATLVLYFQGTASMVTGQASWRFKDKEAVSRLQAVPILLYHNIDGAGPFSISSETLRTHFQHFKDTGVRVIALKELVRRLEHPEPFSGRTIVITFDDGYPSMHSILLPIAREFGYPITLFVHTENIGKKAGQGLTWDKIRELDRSGIDIQCHSISHADLQRLSSRNTPESRHKLYEEIVVSRKIFDLYLGKDMEFFAFPYGRYDLAVLDMCQKAGYRRVFSTDYGSNVLTRDNFCLRRHHIKRSYTLEFIDQIIR